MNWSPSKAVFRDLYFRIVWFFLTEGIKMKFAEKKRPPNPELLRWTSKNFFKKITRQKGIHGGEVSNNANNVHVS